MKGIKHLVVAFCTFLDWVAYLSLLCISLSITWHVIDKFRSKSTNILQYEEPITKRPVITFCFDGNHFGGLIHDMEKISSWTILLKMEWMTGMGILALLNWEKMVNKMQRLKFF